MFPYIVQQVKQKSVDSCYGGTVDSDYFAAKIIHAVTGYKQHL